MRLFGRGKRAPGDDPDSFGNIAIDKNYITREILNYALRCQEARSPLGEVLVRIGAISDFQKEEILTEQQRRKGLSRRELIEAEGARQRRLTSTMRTSLAELTQVNKAVVAALKK